MIIVKKWWILVKKLKNRKNGEKNFGFVEKIEKITDLNRNWDVLKIEIWNLEELGKN